MSILTENPAPIIPTADQRARRIKQHISSTWRQIVHAHQHGMNLLWQSGDATPEEIVAALGTDAAEAFALSAALATLIEGVDATQVVPVPEGVTVTANEDGSVTLS